MMRFRQSVLPFLVSVVVPLSAQAGPIDDCNQSEDAEKQIAGCTDFLQLEPLSPHVALAYGLRGSAYARKGNGEKALADFDQALEIDPRQVRIYINRGNLYRDKGDLERAIADFGAAIKIDPQFADAYVNRCVAYK